MFFPVIRNSSNKRRIGGAALIRGRRSLTFLSQMRRLIEGGAYSSKYGSVRSRISLGFAGGGGVLPYMGYIGMCRCEGYGFQAVYSSIGYINQNVWV